MLRTIFGATTTIPVFVLFRRRPNERNRRRKRRNVVIERMYASKRRQRNFKRVREPAKPGAATNPSKRHRERLNGELETVAALLPYDSTVISRLDKLSVLRLAVSFLQVKAHFQTCLHEYATLMTSYGNSAPFLAAGIPIPSIMDPLNREQPLIDPSEPGFDAMASRALGGFVLILNPNGEIYYVSENIELYLGFHQSDILHQSLYDMIHSEDRDDIRQQLQYDYKSQKDFENAFEKNVCARFRCLLDNTCGFVRVDIRGKIIPLFGIPPPYSTEPVETPTTYGFAAVCSPFVPPLYIDQPVEDPILKTKHSLDFNLISMDHRVRAILEIEEGKTPMSFYSFVHPEDAICVAEAHKEVAKNSASGLLIYRLISSESRITYYFQSSCRMFFKNGKPEAIGLTHRMLTEVEGTILLEKRSNLKAKLLSFDDSLLQSPQNLQSTAALPTQIIPRVIEHNSETAVQPLPAPFPLEPKKPIKALQECPTLLPLLYSTPGVPVPQYNPALYPTAEPTVIDHYNQGFHSQSEDLMAFAAAVPSYHILPLQQDMPNQTHLVLDNQTHASLKAHGYPIPQIVYPTTYPGTLPSDYANPYPTPVPTADPTTVHPRYFYPQTSSILAPRATHSLPENGCYAEEAAFMGTNGYKGSPCFCHSSKPSLSELLVERRLGGPRSSACELRSEFGDRVQLFLRGCRYVDGLTESVICK
ncbi:hypothetical protein L596_008145 [Steinernema carpocapsae]|uniref:Aryl hydrocarbon receptor n=1 Tax=Steinernema carpocapsae TaxID=34508 RepID=A0A4U5PC27_STECR|nr:hypothetical protein L596_008145 [Steinernema carpocapsae]